MIHKRCPGHLLIANPSNPLDELSESVILLISHDDNLAMGLQINNPIADTSLQGVSDNLGIPLPGEDKLWFGGKISQNKVHVIHSTDWLSVSSTLINDDLAVTNDVSVLAALSLGSGPEFFRACVGHWACNGKDLDLGLAAQHPFPGIFCKHRWETIPATPELIFNNEGPEQWRQLLDASTRQQIESWF